MNLLEFMNGLYMTINSHLLLFWLGISVFVGVFFSIYTLRRQITIPDNERKLIGNVGFGLCFTFESIAILVSIATGRALPLLALLILGLTVLQWITINVKPTRKQ